MSKYNVSTLAKKLSEKSGLNQMEAELFIRKMFDVANQGLDTDKLLKIKWLGSFKVTSVRNRESIDVNTGERILIEGRDKISFAPDNVLKEIVNKPFAQFETVVVEEGVDFDDIDRKFDAIPVADELDDEEVGEKDILQEIQSEKVAESKGDSNRVSSVLKNVSADLNSSLNSNPIADEKEINVINFLDLPCSEETSNQVVVVGEDASILLGDKQETKNDQKAQEENDVLEKIEPQEKTSEIQECEKHEDVINGEETECHQEDLQNQQKVDGFKDSEMSNVSDAEIEHPLVQKEYTTEPIDTLSHTQRNVGLDNPKDRLENLEKRDEILRESEEELRRRHFVLPKYLVVAAILVFLVMIGGFGWFAFNYGKIAAQRDHLALQLDKYQAQKTNVAVSKSKVVDADSQEEYIWEKARQDSLRMVQASEAVKTVESAEKKQAVDRLEEESSSPMPSSPKKKVSDKEKKMEKQDVQKTHAMSIYDDDVRVRTGAYRIVGVAQVVKVGAGQTLSSISSRYLGPGMECYIEALNGVNSVKAGQSIKIPKLELKKKK